MIIASHCNDSVVCACVFLQAELQESMNSIAELLQKFEHTGASHPGSFLSQAMNELGKQLKEASVTIVCLQLQHTLQ